jgi:catechol 2,3-dioxygenase
VSDYRAPSGTTIGHVHLKVSNTDRAYDFYTTALGLDTILRFPTAAFLSAGGYHHHIGLNQWYSRGGTRKASPAAGLESVAINFTSEDDLRDAIGRVQQVGVAMTSGDGKSSFAVRVCDPDGIAIDLTCDSTQSLEPIDLSDASAPVNATIAPTASIRSLDLHVRHLAAQVAFYRDVLGLLVSEESPGSVRLGTDQHPYLIGLHQGNADGGQELPSEPGLYHLALLYPTRSDLARATERMLTANAGFRMAEDHGVSNAVYFLDPENNGIELYWDRPRAEWPRNDEGGISMDGGLLDLTALLAEA